MKNKSRIFITRKIHPEVIARLEEIAEVETWPQAAPPPKEILVQKAPEIDGFLTMLTDPIDAEVIAAGRQKLKVIAQMAVGYDNIDISAATRSGIPVGHTPGVLTETTADFTWALLLAAARRLVEADQEVRSGLWQPWGPDILTGLDVYGKTLGIIGLGRIGKAVARRAHGFDMRILYADPTRDPEAEANLGVDHVSLDDLLARADFISLHLNYTPKVRHLINREGFEQMKSTAVLINTARGALVDPDALTWALQTGRIAAAALDVFDPEPIPQEHPLLKLNNLVITPHIASASKETRRKMALMTAENLIAGLQGNRLPYCANPEVYQ